ncbi:MAG TPA: phosphodiesterase [Reyranella sp.]|nr:phosphodiesterase [Reyranella sp.]
MLIAQLSDPHVRPQGMLYQGVVDSNAMFRAAIAQVNGLDPQPDVVLLTGDLVDKGTLDEYEMLRGLLAPLRAPFLAIPGNHDEREAFRWTFFDQPHTPSEGPINYVADGFGPLRIVAVDVTLPGLHHGDFDEDHAQWLDRVLAAEPERPTLIMLHHPPFECSVPYMDTYICRNGERLKDVVARHPTVERIVCGHVHRHMQLRFGGTLLCTAPSTTTAIALQFRPDAEPQSCVEPPAFLLHHWRPEVGLITHLLPIGTFAGPYPFA